MPQSLHWRLLTDTAVPTDLADVLAAAPEDTERFCWLQPARDLQIVGVGAALVWAPPAGEDGLAPAAEFVERLARGVHPAPAAPRRAPAGLAPAGPVVCGGFAFDPASPDLAGSPWAGFGPGRLVVPELTGVATGGSVRWIVAARPGSLPGAAARAQRLLRCAAGLGPPSALPVTSASLDGDGGPYLQAIEAALAQIHAGTLAKVVPARQVALGFTDPPGRHELRALLARLATRYPTATTFAVGRGPVTLLGATPELLVRTNGATATSAALAGSCARGNGPAGDEALAEAMLASAKERREHDAVVEHLRRCLTAAGVVLGPVPAEPRVRTLPGIQHLWTPLAGRCSAAAGELFRLAAALHPTPAVAGLPAGEALAFLRRHEPAGRGWFAGPVGWSDLAGNGELRLALRSGLVDFHSTEMLLFAGSGIVAGSVAGEELAETDTKLNAVPAVLDAQPVAAAQ